MCAEPQGTALVILSFTVSFGGGEPQNGRFADLEKERQDRRRSLDAVPYKGKDKSFSWQDITPEELQPAVTAIRKAFGDASWRCGESTRRLCFAVLHPTPGNQQPTIPATDLGSYKKYLVAAIGNRNVEVIGRPNQTPPAIFSAYRAFIGSV